MMIYGSNIEHAEAVTPSDSADLSSVSSFGPAHFLYVGTSGDVVITTRGGDVTFSSMAAGVWHAMPPITRVKSTNTTASNIVAGY